MEWQRLLVSIIKAFILIHWAFIIQIIIGVLAGRKARDTNRSVLSCRKHQMSKLFIVPVVLPDIIPDIVFFIRYCRNEPLISKDGIRIIRYQRKTFDIEEKTFDIKPDIQKLHVFAT